MATERSVVEPDEITARHDTAAALRDSEERFRAIWAASPDPMALSDPEGILLRVNPAYCDLYGYRAEEVLGKSFALIFPENQREWAIEHYRIHFDKEEIEPDVVTTVRRADGSERIVQSRYSFLQQDGQRIAMLSIIHDITEHVRAEEALRESEERFRTTFEGAPVGISLIDPEGRYIAVNQVRQEMLGFSREELIGRRYSELTHPEDLERDREVNEEARSQGRGRFQLEKRFVRKDGQVAWTRITVSPVPNIEGKLSYSVSVAEDITDQKEAEAALARLYALELDAREKMEQLASEKDDFLSAVAHDLRTPLTSIKGRIQLVRRRLARGNSDPERVLDDLARMESSVTRMVSLISELLDIANIKIGQPLKLVYRPIDLVELARAVVAEAQEATNVHRILVTAHEPELPGIWDAARLERVLANLLSNAVKYSPESGEITVQVSRVTDHTGSWAELSVTDQGIGIPVDDLPNIFDRFHRGGNVAGKIPGTGIGLAAVQAIVEQHGGSVSVQSCEGQGTTFQVRLPLDESTPR